MQAAKKEIFGDTTKKTSTNGPHLLTGKGTPYNLAKITSGFVVQDTRPGHAQKKNVEIPDNPKPIKGN